MALSDSKASIRQLRAWFDAFTAQSHAPHTRRGLAHPRPFGGGTSGASAALFSFDNGWIVLKWDVLDRVLEEADVRRRRALASPGSSENERFRDLRSRNASHIAVRTVVSPEGWTELYGIIAYAYAGPENLVDSPFVGDLDSLIQSKFVTGGYGEEWMRTVFDAVLAEFDPVSHDDGHGPENARTEWAALANALNIERSLDVARDRLTSDGLGDECLDLVEDWWSEALTSQRHPGFADSRLVHGDPRLANILLDARAPMQIELIDFGAGGPGRHVFHDLARLEVDLLLRAASSESDNDRVRAVRHRARILRGSVQVSTGDPKSDHVVSIWRAARNHRFRDLDRPDVQTLYSMFLVKELLRRIKWHTEGNSVEDVGASVDEIAAAIQVQVEDSLWEQLAEADVELERWGTGEAKTREHLLDELLTGLCTLDIQASGVIRRVRVVWVDVHADTPTGRAHLVEHSQTFTDGRERRRHPPASLGEKCRPAERPLEAAHRALREELGIERVHSLTPGTPRANSVNPGSFPGLTTLQEAFWFVAELEPDDVDPDGYTEIQSDKRTRFVWES